MKLYNTLTRRIDEVTPLTPGLIRMYSCGPTVYRYIHVGNLRTFAMADWLRRAFEYGGLEVRHVKNITDVGHMRQEMLDRGEDKLIAQARAEGKSSAEIAAFYTAAFREDERQLNILPAHIFPKATDHIPEMIAIVERLVANGVAYEVEGNVFYDVTRFPRYGALSGNLLEQALSALREDANALKRHPEDFPLWKRAEPGREMAWDSPWGRGFPGWHIECSAMAIRYLGPHLDLHTGGIDNLFPHHEDEIAQSEAYTGERFVDHWVHAQHLLSDGQKMAKSTGNAYTLSDLLARGFDPMALRYLFTTAHYRSRINFTFSALRAAERGLERLRLALARLVGEAGEVPATCSDAGVLAHRARFLAAIDDDLNLPRAMAVVWSLARGEAGGAAPGERAALLLDLDRILGLDLAGWLARRERTAGDRAAPPEVAPVLAARAAARAERRFADADTLRRRIAALGHDLRDERDGTVVVPRRPEQDYTVISRSSDVREQFAAPDLYDVTVALVAHNSRGDLARCIESIARHGHGRSLQIVVVDNGSTDDTPAYLRRLASEGARSATDAVALEVLFGDHDLGFAAARNAATRAALGRVVVWMDTSIEVTGDIWTPLLDALADPVVGLVGPYALVTDDLKEFSETAGPQADAVEGYLMAFRRAQVQEVGSAEERFRFYRLLDIYMSFMFKTAGYGVVRTPLVADRVLKHPHREWYSLTEEERRVKSKRNYDLFRRRWHHGQSLLAANYARSDHYVGHDHGRHVGGTHGHAAHELPPRGVQHVHLHQHWPDHSHEHPHYHDPSPAHADREPAPASAPQ